MKYTFSVLFGAVVSRRFRVLCAPWCHFDRLLFFPEFCMWRVRKNLEKCAIVLSATFANFRIKLAQTLSERNMDQSAAIVFSHPRVIHFSTVMTTASASVANGLTTHWYMLTRTRARMRPPNQSKFIQQMPMFTHMLIAYVDYLFRFSAATRAQPTSNNLSSFFSLLHVVVAVGGEWWCSAQKNGTSSRIVCTMNTLVGTWAFSIQNGFVMFVFASFHFNAFTSTSISPCLSHSVVRQRTWFNAKAHFLSPHSVHLLSLLPRYFLFGV